MSRFLNIVLASVLLLPFALAGLVLALYLLVDPNDFRDDIARFVHERTGRELTIEGGIRLSFFPWLGVELGAARLGNPPVFAGGSFAQVDAARVRARLLPLLGRRLEADTVRLDGLRLNLQRRADGSATWDGLTTGGRDAGGGPPRLAAFAVGGLELREASADWDDAISGTRYRVRGLSLSTGALAPARTVPVELVLDLQGEGLTTRIEGRARVALDPATQRLNLAQTELRVGSAGPIAGAEDVNLVLRGPLGMDLAAGTLGGTGLALEAAARLPGAEADVKGTLEGNLSLSWSGAAPARLDAARLRLHATAGPQGERSARLALDGDLVLEPGSRQGAGAPEAAGLRLDVRTGTLELRAPELNLDSLQARFSGALALADAVASVSDLMLEAEAVAEVAAQPGVRLWLQARGTPAYELVEGALSWPDLRLDARARLPDGQAAVELQGATALRWHRGPRRLEARGLSLRAKASGSRLPAGKVSGELNADASADLAAGRVRLDGLELELAGVQAGGQVTVEQLYSDTSAEGVLSIAPFSARALLARLGLEPPATADPGALTRASLSTRFLAGAERLDLQGLELVLDDTRAVGEVHVRAWRPPSARFDLTLDELDLDRYLAPPAPARSPPAMEKPAAGAAKAASRVPERAVPAAAMALAELDGELRVGRLKLNNVRAQKVQAKLRSGGGSLDVAPISARLYAGELNGELGLKLAGESARIRTRQQLREVQIGPLLRDLTGKDMLSGKASLATELTAQGSDAHALTRSLGGWLELGVKDGALKGVNIADRIRRARAALRGLPAGGSEPQQTDFTELRASATIDGGVLRSDDLSAKSPLLRVSGQGTADLVQRTLDWRIQTVLVQSTAGQGGRDLADLKGLPIPIRITGTFDAPSYDVDKQALVRKTVERVVRERLQDKLQEKLGDGLQRKVLEGLFGR